MPKKIPTPEGAVLHSFRRSKGMTEVELADAVRVTPQTIRNWESGRQIPSPSRLEEVLGAIGVPPQAIAEALLAHRLGNTPEEPASFAMPSGKEARLIHEASAAAGGAAAEAVRSRLIREWRQRLAQDHRRWAEELWAKLKKLPHQKQEMLVDVLLDERSWALAERVCQASVVAAAHKADEALRLARLAVRIAERLPGPESRRRHMTAYCTDFEANALRVEGDLIVAEEVFLRADKLWRQCENSDFIGILDDRRRLDLKASLFMLQEHFEEARLLLETAIARVPNTRGARERLLIKKARVLELAGQHNAALEVLAQMKASVEELDEPRISLSHCFKTVVNLCHLDRFEEAERLLPQVKAMLGDNELDRVRVRWLEGRTCSGLALREEALTAFSQVRQYFRLKEIDYDFALVTLELAALHLEQGRLKLVQSLAEEMLWIFQRQKIHKEALAALMLFWHAAQANEISAAWVKSLVRYLYRAQHAPSLKFELQKGDATE